MRQVQSLQDHRRMREGADVSSRGRESRGWAQTGQPRRAVGGLGFLCVRRGWDLGHLLLS